MIDTQTRKISIDCGEVQRFGFGITKKSTHHEYLPKNDFYIDGKRVNVDEFNRVFNQMVNLYGA